MNFLAYIISEHSPVPFSFVSAQGYTPSEILIPLMDPFIAFLVRQQVAQYHLILDLVPRGALVPQEDFRLCLLAETDVFDTRLAYPLLAKPCNIFLGLSIIKQVGIRVQGVHSASKRTPPGLPDPLRSIFVEGRINSAKVIVPDLVSSNGVVQIIDTMLIPPTAELGMTILDRIARTPWLKVRCYMRNASLTRSHPIVLQVYEEIVLILGLQGEFRGQCLPPGDATVFAPIDIAWLAFFAKLSMGQDAVFESFTAILYDVILFSTVTERAEDFTLLIDEVRIESFILAVLVLTRSSQGVTERDFVFPTLEPQFLSNGEVLATTLQRYWQTPADLKFYRHDTFAKKGGSLITQVRCIFEES